MIKLNNACCFFGHRKIKDADIIRKKLYDIIEFVIVEEKIDTFLFGSRSEFDKLCYQVVSQLKVKYSHIKRIYVRGEFPYINDNYRANLLKKYEDTYYPDHIIGAGRAVYVERNQEIINRSKVCVVYYDENYLPMVRKADGDNSMNCSSKSGTRLAYNYALKKQKKIINVFMEENK